LRSCPEPLPPASDSPGSVPLTCHYGRHPRDTPGRSGPRNSQRTKHIPMRSCSSQADSAGSIPVTRSKREKCCHTYELSANSPSGAVPVGIRNQLSCHYRVPLTMHAGLSANRCKWPDTLSYGLARRGRHDRETVGRESNFEGAFTSALRQRRTQTVDTTSRGRDSFVECLLVPGLLCPRHLGEERVDGPEVPGGLVAADAVAGTGHHDGPDRCAPPPAGAPSASPAAQGAGSARQARPSVLNHHGRETRDAVRALKRI
jgi:hypothetical protein